MSEEHHLREIRKINGDICFILFIILCVLPAYIVNVALIYDKLNSIGNSLDITNQLLKELVNE